MLEAGL
jgi:hypothetical protein